MDDLRENVIKGLRYCEPYGYCTEKQCPYYECVGCLKLLRDNVLELLKAQDPIRPKVNIDTWVCGNCGTRIERQSMIGPHAVLAETFKFCPECGKAVKWDD